MIDSQSVKSKRKRTSFSRVPSKFFGIRDLACLKTGIRDFRGKGERDSGFLIMNGIRDLAVLRCEFREMLL